MNQRHKTLLYFSIVLAVIITIYFFLSSSPPADPNSDRIVYRLASSFPGATGIFVNYEIYVANIDRPGLTRITQLDDIPERPTWSPDGNKIAYTWNRGLYLINADGSGQPELLWEGSEQRYPLDPAWSPDDKQIVFADVTALHILDLETKRAVRLGNTSIRGIEPSWSPDGSKIVFTYLSPSSHNSRTYSLGVINADGSNFVQLTPEDGSDSPEWSPDGRKIVFTRNENIYLMNADGTEIEGLRRVDKSFWPTWSPDGKRIAFVSWPVQRCSKFVTYIFEFCHSELYVMNADGSNVELIKKRRDENIAFIEWAP
jgi:Tol biopolymer transport system component